MERKSAERQFLHDISTPLSAAVFLIDMLLESKTQLETEAQDVAHLSTALDALRAVKTLIEKRRAELIAQQNEEGGSSAT